MDMQKKKYQSKDPLLARFTDYHLAAMFIRIFQQNYSNAILVHKEVLFNDNDSILITITDLNHILDEYNY